MKTIKSLASTMRKCALNVSLGILGIGLLVGFIFAAPIVGGSIQTLWYAWARLQTTNYTSVVLAAWIEWISLIATAWSICIAVKTAKANRAACLWFAGISAAVILLGVLPSQCALIATTENWTRDETHTLIERAAEVTAVVCGMLFIAVPALALVIGVSEYFEATESNA